MHIDLMFHMKSAGEPDIMYGGPDADDFGVPDDPFDAHDFDSARAVAVNPRRHTIATTQPQVSSALRL